MILMGSVRSVHLADPLRGTVLSVLSPHNGPVTTICVLRGFIASLAMNDGLCIFKCNGVGDGGNGRGGTAGENGTVTGRLGGGIGVLSTGDVAHGSAKAASVPLEMVMSMQVRCLDVCRLGRKRSHQRSLRVCWAGQGHVYDLLPLSTPFRMQVQGAVVQCSTLL